MTQIIGIIAAVILGFGINSGEFSVWFLVALTIIAELGWLNEKEG